MAFAQTVPPSASAVVAAVDLSPAFPSAFRAVHVRATRRRLLGQGLIDTMTDNSSADSKRSPALSPARQSHAGRVRVLERGSMLLGSRFVRLTG